MYQLMAAQFGIKAFELKPAYFEIVGLLFPNTKTKENCSPLFLSSENHSETPGKKKGSGFTGRFK